MTNITTLLNDAFVGDVLEQLRTLPNNSIDLSITSPPYNKKLHNRGWLVKNNGYSHFDDLMPEDQYQEWQIQVLNELFRVTKPGGSFFYNHKIRWVDGNMFHPYAWISQSDWAIRQEIVWDRGIAANMRGWRFWQQDERIYWLYKPIEKNLVGQELASRHAKMSSVWRITPAPRSDDHPAIFPIELPTRIIYSFSDNEPMVVLDPFCGAGTTLVAARILGHNFIGFDISPDYIAYSRQRLENYEKEVDQVEEECARHIIDDPFANRKKRGTVNWPYGPKGEQEEPPQTVDTDIDEVTQG